MDRRKFLNTLSVSAAASIAGATTLTAKADGLQGYGMVLFNHDKRQITFELHTLDANREPKQILVPGWPKHIQISR